MSTSLPASSTGPVSGPEASALLDARIASLDDWRGAMLARVRALIHEALPAVVEELKWRGTPVWSQDGILCTGETYKAVVKLTFAHGAALADPAGLFNASLEGTTRRAIDLHVGEALDGAAFQALVQATAQRNARARSACKSASQAKARPRSEA